MPAQKEFQEYLTDPATIHKISHEDYMRAPAVAFLKYTVEAKDAVNFCINKFPKNRDGKYTKDSMDSLQHIVVSMLPALMGHFETFQRYMFAGMFDYSIFLKDFSVDEFFRILNKSANISIDLVRLSAYRGYGTTSVGLLLADSLPGWHNPEKINSYFNAFGLQYQIYDTNACEQLSVLWQLRHSIVHTGGTITLPDAQKVPSLSSHGGKQVVFEKHFIFEVARKLHPLIKKSVEGIGIKYIENLMTDISVDDKNKIKNFFEVKSSVNVWLR